MQHFVNTGWTWWLETLCKKSTMSQALLQLYSVFSELTHTEVFLFVTLSKMNIFMACSIWSNVHYYRHIRNLCYYVYSWQSLHYVLYLIKHLLMYIGLCVVYILFMSSCTGLSASMNSHSQPWNRNRTVSKHCLSHSTEALTGGYVWDLWWMNCERPKWLYIDHGPCFVLHLADRNNLKY